MTRNGSTQFFWLKSDGSGDYEPATFGLLYSYEAGSTVPKSLFRDPLRHEYWTNPLVLDHEGRATFFLDRRGHAYSLRLNKTNGDCALALDNVRSMGQ